MDQKQIVLDIAMNLNRVGNWVADGFDANRNRIDTFLNDTDTYIQKVDKPNPLFEKTWNSFMLVYPKLKANPKNNAENLMTWGNILTHRSKFI